MNLIKVLHNENLTREEIIFLLSLTDKHEIELLFRRADDMRKQICGDDVHLRGIIEISNYCNQNCFYCGLREENKNLIRYRMKPEEIIETAQLINQFGIHTIVLQSGEDPEFDTDEIAYIIYTIKQKTDSAITLSLGEREFEEYRKWRIAGADRYLLKHETANYNLYSLYHTKQNLNDRIEHLKFLKTIGYQIGSGNMIGLPMQTIEDIADDILLCRQLDLDMAAIGPFIPSPNTPYQFKKSGDVELTLKTMAVARLALKYVHIPATTALATLDKEGRVKGLNVGANVVMPDFTPKPYRDHYQIYPDRKFVSDKAAELKPALQAQIESIGRRISTSKGDSMKFTHQQITNWSFK
jgi:biotin synthase